MKAATKNDTSAPYASVLFDFCGQASSWPGGGAVDVERGDENNRGSNQLPRKSKMQELDHEQEEQKRTTRRAEQ